MSLSAAHCDNADFLAGDYPQTRDQATAAALDCIVQLQVRFEEGVRSAANLLDEQVIISRRPYGARPNPPRMIAVGYKARF